MTAIRGKSQSAAQIKARQQGSQQLGQMRNDLNAQAKTLNTSTPSPKAATNYNSGPKFGGVKADENAAKVIAENKAKAEVAAKKTYQDNIKARRDLISGSRNTGSKIEPLNTQQAKDVLAGNAKPTPKAPKPVNVGDSFSSSSTTPASVKGTSKLANTAKWAGRAGAAVAVAVEGYEVYDSYKKGGTKAAVKQTGKSAVALGGAWAGAKGGAAIGTAICPGLGTLIGGAVGGIGGYLLGKFIGDKTIGDSKGEKSPTAPEAPVAKKPATPAPVAKKPATPTPVAKKPAPAPGKVGEDGIYTVKKGDCVWNVVKANFPDAKTDAQIAALVEKVIVKNGLDKPEHEYGNLIFPLNNLDLNVK